MSQQHQRLVHNPEDKLAYCKESETTEAFFIDMMNRHSQLTIMKNPEKDKTEKGIYAADLWVPGWGLCDLKAQQTPFFTSRKKSGIEPNKAVTFNQKDVQRYSEIYENIGIFFWVNWVNNTDERFGTVNYRWGVYFIRLHEIREIIASNISKNHVYLNRKEEDDKHFLAQKAMNRQGNAKDSWFLSIDWMEPVIASHDNPWNFQ
jgi:hypothetical protein